MINYARETLFDVIQEVEPLLESHYQELTLNRDRIKLAPMWEQYAALERAGKFILCTARRDGILIGYGGFFVTQHMHFSGLTMAINDALFLRKKDRVGRTGYRLIEFCEQELARAIPGEFKLTWSAKYCNKLAAILERMGYAKEEMILGKMFP